MSKLQLHSKVADATGPTRDRRSGVIVHLDTPSLEGILEGAETLFTVRWADGTREIVEESAITLRYTTESAGYTVPNKERNRLVNQTVEAFKRIVAPTAADYEARDAKAGKIMATLGRG